MGLVLESELDLTKIRIYKPVSLGCSNNLLFKIHGPLVVQTKNMFLCYTPLTDEKRRISLVFASKDKFKWLTDLEQRIGKRIRSYKESKSSESSESSESRLFSPLWKETLRLTVHESALSISNQDGSPVHLVMLQKRTEVKAIIHVQNVWTSATQWGLSLQLLQIQLLQVKLEYKYEKMLKLGVPLDAVRQRMRIEGIQDPSCLDGKEGKKQPPPPPPPGPPPPPPPPFVNRVLKINAPSPKPVSRNKSWVPSCNDILEGRNRLKSLEKVYYSGYVPLRPIIK